jgi:hypothetical protein
VQPVDPLDLLLLTELNGVVGLLPAALLRRAVLPRRILAPLDGAFVRVALLTLQEELLAFAAAELANGSGIA